MENHHNCRQLRVGAFAFAFGLSWGLGMLLMGWACGLSQWGAMMIQVLSSVYLGYAPTFWGAIVGGIWGFVDFFIFGAVIAWIYNNSLGRGRQTSSEGQ